MTINGPLDLALWRDRLINNVPALRKVGLAADLPASREGPVVTPGAFVVPISDAPRSRAGGSSVLSQNVDATVGIVIVVTNRRGAAEGSAATEDIQVIRRSIMDVLIGWQPDGADGAVQYSAGRLLAYAGSVLWWTDRFSTAYFIRKEFTS